MDGNEVEEADIEQQTLQEMLGEPEKRQGERDARWNSVRKEHIRTHSFCIACGNTSNLEAHHIKPFSQNPELELDPNNLVTLCTCSVRGKMNCHLIMGHNGSMQEHNPNVVHDSIQMLKRVNRDKYEEICKKAGTLSLLVRNGLIGCNSDKALKEGDRIISRGLLKVQSSDSITTSTRLCKALTLRLAEEKAALLNLVRKATYEAELEEDLEFIRALFASSGLRYQKLLSDATAEDLEKQDSRTVFKVQFDSPGDHGVGCEYAQ